MSQDISAVEATQPAATGNGVETNQPIAPEVDSEAVISQLLDENKRLETERDNYRRGILKAKGKLPEEEVDASEEDLDARIERKVSERLLETQWAANQKRLEEELKKQARENKELKKSLANRSQLSSTGQGSGQAEMSVPDSSLSPDMLQQLKARGWSDDKIARFKKNRLALGK